jgi:PAS domain S-box-containing protein
MTGKKDAKRGVTGTGEREKTARKLLQLAEMQLAESEKRNRELVQHSSAGIYEVNFQTNRLTAVNDMMCELSGYTRQELLGMNPMDILAPESRVLFQDRIQKWLGGEKPDPNVEYRVIKKDGSEFFALLSVSFTRAPDGTPLGATVVGYDITERKKIEQALRDSEARANALIKNAPLSIYEIDNRGPKFISVNDAVCKTLGYSREELLAIGPMGVLEEQSQALFAERMQRQMAGEQINRTVEYKVRKKDGSFIDANIHISLNLWENEPHRVLVMAEDITERNLAEQKIHQSEAALRGILDATKESIWMFNPEGIILLANETALARMHMPAEKVIGKNFCYLIPREIALNRMNCVQAVIRTGQPVELEDERAGMCFHHTFYPIQDAGNQVVRIAAFSQDITEKKRIAAEATQLLASIQEEKERLKILVDNISDEVWFADISRKFTLMNPAALREFGIRPGEEVDVEKFAASLEVFRPDGSPRFIDEAPPLRALAGEIIKNQQEITRVPSSGELRHREVSATPVKDSNGKIIGSISVVRDITDRKKAEEALLESQQKYQALIETTSDFIWEMDTQGRYTYCSPQMENLWGLDQRELIGKTPFDLMPLEDRERAMGFFQELTQSHQPFANLVTTAVVKGGSLGFVETSGVPFFDAQGNFAGYRGISRDITGRRHAEEAVRASEERFKAIASSTPDHILVQDRNLRYTFVVNPQLGLTEQDMLGKTDQDILAKEDAEHLTKLKRQVMETGQPVHTEFTLLSLAGERLFFSGSYVPKFDAQGQVDGLIGYFRNVTELKHAEEALARRNERLALLSETASELLASTQPQHVVEELCWKVLRHLDCDIFVNYLVDGDASRLHLNTCGGIHKRVARLIEQLEFGQAICGSVARLGERIVAENIQETKDPRADLVRRMGVQAYCCHPLIASGRVIGTLSFGTKKRAHFSKDELSVMKTVADYVAIAIGRYQAEEDLLKARDALQSANLQLQAEIVERERLMTQLKEKGQQAEAYAREAEKHSSEIEAVFNALTDSIIAYGPDQVATRANPAARSLLGFDPTGLHLEKNMARVGTQGGSKGSVTLRALEGEEIKEAEFDFTSPSGEPRTVLASSTPIRDAQGNILGAVTVSRDITERKRAEVTRAWLASFPEKNPNPVVEVELSGIVRYANPVSQRLFPDLQEKNSGHAWLADLNRIVEAFAGGQANLLTRDVSIGKHSYQQTFFYDPQNGYIRIYALDITDRKRAEMEVQTARDELELRVVERTQQLAQANAYNRSLIEASLDPLVTITSDGKIGDVNSATEKATGLSSQMLIGTDFHSYFSDPEKARTGYRQVFETGSVHDYELELRHQDGHVTPVLYNAAVYRDATGTVQGVFAAARDISAQRHAEAELGKYRQHLEDLIRERTGQLEAANAQLQAEITEREQVEEQLRQARDELELRVQERTLELNQSNQQLRLENEERQRMADSLHDAVNQSLFSAGLIAEVLPRLWERNQEEARKSLKDLRKLTRSAQGEMRALLAELRPSVVTDSGLDYFLEQLSNAFTGRTNLPVTINIKGEMNLQPEAQVVFYRVAQEALNNIAKHAKASRVEVEFQNEPDQATMRIKDDGRGFDPQELKGIHYGLRMMQERAKTIGARLSIDSQPGHGTRLQLSWKKKEKKQGE